MGAVTEVVSTRQLARIHDTLEYEVSSLPALSDQYHNCRHESTDWSKILKSELTQPSSQKVL